MQSFVYSFLADATMAVHFLFVAFVLAGGVFVLLKPQLAWLHVPAMIWGVWITVTQGVCPLTPIEQWFRAEANEATYSGGFIAHYIQPVLYPAGMSYEMKLYLGAFAILLTLLFYWRGFYRLRRIGNRDNTAEF